MTTSENLVRIASADQGGSCVVRLWRVAAILPTPRACAEAYGDAGWPKTSRWTAARGGSESAFAGRLRAIAPQLYSFLCVKRGAEARAGDVLQQTMLEFTSRVDRFTKNARAVLPWAYAIAELSRSIRRVSGGGDPPRNRTMTRPPSNKSRPLARRLRGETSAHSDALAKASRTQRVAFSARRSRSRWRPPHFRTTESAI